MSTHLRPRKRRHLRFTRYLPVQCTVLSPNQPQPQPLEGMTRNVNAGGLEILLPEALPVKTLVSVRVAEGDPIRGHVVSVGEDISTVLGTRFPHGLAFEQPVDASLLRRWVSQPQKRRHARARVQFGVEYTQARTTAHGTCLSLCKAGMFIATERPVAPGKEITLCFTLPGLSDPLFVRAQVPWMSGEVSDWAVITGMGVQFLDLDPSKASAIGTLVDRLCAEASAPDPFPSLPPSRHTLRKQGLTSTAPVFAPSPPAGASGTGPGASHSVARSLPGQTHAPPGRRSRKCRPLSSGSVAPKLRAFEDNH